MVWKTTCLTYKCAITWHSIPPRNMHAYHIHTNYVDQTYTCNAMEWDNTSTYVFLLMCEHALILTGAHDWRNPPRGSVWPKTLTCASSREYNMQQRWPVHLQNRWKPNTWRAQRSTVFLAYLVITNVIQHQWPLEQTKTRNNTATL